MATEAAIAEAEARREPLKGHIASTDDRHVTEVRTRMNPKLPELYSNLITLQMRRMELLDKYSPTYRLVVELDEQIAKKPWP